MFPPAISQLCKERGLWIHSAAWYQSIEKKPKKNQHSSSCHTYPPFLPQSSISKLDLHLKFIFYNPISCTAFNKTITHQMLFGLWTACNKNNNRISFAFPFSSPLSLIKALQHLSNASDPQRQEGLSLWPGASRHRSQQGGTSAQLSPTFDPWASQPLGTDISDYLSQQMYWPTFFPQLNLIHFPAHPMCLSPSGLPLSAYTWFVTVPQMVKSIYLILSLKTELDTVQALFWFSRVPLALGNLHNLHMRI